MEMKHSDNIIWNTGLYVRLSAEDERKKASGSVETQKELLLNYIQDKPDMLLYSIYVDVDKTGANFERPEFQRMMSDVKAGVVTCIVVKDLSRFGRNFLDSSDYIEQIFPLLGVRFISVNDNFDSINYDNNPNMSVALKNLMNDILIKDLSRRIKSSLFTVMKEGYFRGGTPPYGYISVKDEEGKARLYIDKETAPIVRQIFQWKIEGKGYGTIARTLNQQHMIPPQKRLQQLGFRLNKTGDSDLWLSSSLRRIIMNPVYIGSMVQHKYEVMQISSKKIKSVAPEDWIYVPNTHEAIVTKEMFEAANETVRATVAKQKGRNQWSKVLEKTPNVLKGLVYCKDCGRKMQRKSEVSKDKTHYIYHFSCMQYMRAGSCTPHRISEKIILKAIKDALSVHIHLIQLAKRKLEKNAKAIEEQEQEKKAKLTKLKRKISTLKTSKRDLYEKLLEGDVSEPDYLLQKNKIEDDINHLEQEMTASLSEQEEKSALSDKDREWVHVVESLKGKRNLTHEQLGGLIEKIIVDDNKHIEIVFSYSSPFLNSITEGGIDDER